MPFLARLNPGTLPHRASSPADDLLINLHDVSESISISAINGTFGDGQLCVTIKKSTPKIVATLNRIAESYVMLELQAILA